MIRLKNLLSEATLSTDNDFREQVKSWEGPGPVDANNNHLAYDDANPSKAASPGQSVRGTLTIGYGTTDSVLPGLKPGMKISPQQAEQLLTKGISEHELKARRVVPKYDSLPKYVRMAILNAIYRGDLGPKATDAINSGDWKLAAELYLQHKNFTNPGKFPGVVARMQSNADAFNKYAIDLKSIKKVSKPKSGLTGVDWMDSAIKSGLYKVRPGDQLLPIANKFGLTLDLIKGMNGMTNDDIRVGQVLKVK
jgi:GH24 family phage-related lysozyme (muramidase)